MAASRDRSGLAGASLFERLSAPNHPVPSADVVEATVTSIKRHLVELLNSHPGHSECAPGLGLLDLNDATLGALDLELKVESAIRECIERYEPRVHRVHVETQHHHDNDPLQLRFQVQAVLDVDHDMAETTIDLLLNDKRYLCLN
ncbi:type VI secretion system baseplate subunit TssE [Halomonas sp. I1]|uniref:type VI secretion system baseplate subunit TssE n=1 Tax=Halomonas sp. I1 TaxID=393536 RepID=UPI0028DD823F|nr:type VI secretion system baseplate subunit TssE [Halomonas sp. I1]MDT8893319.1 type VI secretion system baseplate subunit TssE [Halomonas sp. I1]